MIRQLQCTPVISQCQCVSFINLLIVTLRSLNVDTLFIKFRHFGLVMVTFCPVIVSHYPYIGPSRLVDVTANIDGK